MQQNLVSRAPVAAGPGPCPRRLRTGKVAAHASYPESIGKQASNGGHSSVAILKSCQPQDASAVNKHKNSTSYGIRKDMFFEVEMRVCDDDLDEYGVVNNAVYASYIHDARNTLLEALGLNVHFRKSTGNSMALSELNLKYFTPLRSGDKFVVKLRVVQIKGVRIIVDHMIESLPNHQLVLEARATAFCLDKNHRPTRVFPELASKLCHFFLLEICHGGYHVWYFPSVFIILYLLLEAP